MVAVHGATRPGEVLGEKWTLLRQVKFVARKWALLRQVKFVARKWTLLRHRMNVLAWKSRTVSTNMKNPLEWIQMEETAHVYQSGNACIWGEQESEYWERDLR
mgnify:CR=1 FL=1